MKVLVIQNRMGIGDLIIFLPYIFGVSKALNAPVSLLAQQNTRAKDLLKNNPYIEEIITLDRDDKNRSGRHHGVLGTLNLIQDLRERKFSRSFTFNSSARYALITKMAGIVERHQYPLFKKKQQNIIQAAKDFMLKSIGQNINSESEIHIDEKKINDVKNQFKITSDKLHIVLGVGGSGKTKRVTPEKFIKFMDLINEVKNCIFYLAAGSNAVEQQIVDSILNSTHKNNCITLNKMDIVDTLPVIKNCNLAVCNDSSFSHISAALGIKTLVLMTDTPLLYGSYSSRMTAILPEGLKNVTHDSSAKEKINPEEIYIKAKKILNL